MKIELIYNNLKIMLVKQDKDIYYNFFVMELDLVYSISFFLIGKKNLILFNQNGLKKFNIFTMQLVDFY